jgi:hypothetical protein
MDDQQIIIRQADLKIPDTKVYVKARHGRGPVILRVTAVGVSPKARSFRNLPEMMLK